MNYNRSSVGEKPQCVGKENDRVPEKWNKVGTRHLWKRYAEKIRDFSKTFRNREIKGKRLMRIGKALHNWNEGSG